MTSQLPPESPSINHKDSSNGLKKRISFKRLLSRHSQSVEDNSQKSSHLPPKPENIISEPDDPNFEGIEPAWRRGNQVESPSSASTADSKKTIISSAELPDSVTTDSIPLKKFKVKKTEKKVRRSTSSHKGSNSTHHNDISSKKKTSSKRTPNSQTNRYSDSSSSSFSSSGHGRGRKHRSSSSKSSKKTHSSNHRKNHQSHKHRHVKYRKNKNSAPESGNSSYSFSTSEEYSAGGGRRSRRSLSYSDTYSTDSPSSFSDELDIKQSLSSDGSGVESELSHSNSDHRTRPRKSHRTKSSYSTRKRHSTPKREKPKHSSKHHSSRYPKNYSNATSPRKYRKKNIKKKYSHLDEEEEEGNFQRRYSSVSADSSSGPNSNHSLRIRKRKSGSDHYFSNSSGASTDDEQDSQDSSSYQDSGGSPPVQHHKKYIKSKLIKLSKKKKSSRKGDQDPDDQPHPPSIDIRLSVGDAPSKHPASYKPSFSTPKATSPSKTPSKPPSKPPSLLPNSSTSTTTLEVSIPTKPKVSSNLTSPKLSPRLRTNLPVNQDGFTDFAIESPALATQGRKLMDFTLDEMPGLKTLRKQYSSMLPLRGAMCVLCVNITPETGCFIETLVKLGAKVRVSSCNMYSCNNSVAAALVKSNISVFGWMNQDETSFWWSIRQCFAGAKGRSYTFSSDRTTDLPLPDSNWIPNLLVDDGGDATAVLYREFPSLLSHIKGMTEETFTGMHRLLMLARARKLQTTVLNVQNSVVKINFDNLYSARETIIEAIRKTSGINIAGKECVVCGYGYVGKGVSSALKANGARVSISEIDPICALQAVMEGFKVVDMKSVLSSADIILTCTGGSHIITKKIAERMKKGAFAINCGNIHSEIDVQSFVDDPDIEIVNLKRHVDIIRFSNGNFIKLVAQGRPIHLSCSPISSFIKSVGLTCHALALLELFQAQKGKYSKRVYMYPRSLDEELARLHLTLFSAKLAVLTNEQATYLGLSKQGPYKNATYRY